MPSNLRPDWSTDEPEFRRLAALGHSPAEVRALKGWSLPLIIGWEKRSGLKLRRDGVNRKPRSRFLSGVQTPKEVAAIRALIQSVVDGERAVSKAAEAVGCNIETFEKIAARLGFAVPLPRRGHGGRKSINRDKEYDGDEVRLGPPIGEFREALCTVNELGPDPYLAALHRVHGEPRDDAHPGVGRRRNPELAQ